VTGARVVDPSHASFMGVYSTLTMRGWNDELCDAVGADRRLLPEVREVTSFGGHITQRAKRRDDSGVGGARR